MFSVHLLVAYVRKFYDLNSYEVKISVFYQKTGMSGRKNIVLKTPTW